VYGSTYRAAVAQSEANIPGNREEATFPTRQFADRSFEVYTYDIYRALHLEEAMKTAKLFKNGESQAVRLPKEFRFTGEEVFIKRMGTAVVLLPKSKSWDTLLASLSKFSPDFMEEREQPPQQERESLE
jgi:antitoxin VapB